jgi:molybdenum-dependent DNA-binding transcriptional regulator ModE
MARGQQQGVNAITVWMIVFVALWLTSTVFLVILYTGQEDLHSENTRLQSANRRLISPAEDKAIDLVKSAQESGPTVVGLLEEARSQTAAMASGEAANGAGEVRTKRDQLLRLIRTEGSVSKPDVFEDVSYHDALTRMYEAFKGEHALRQTAEDRAGQLETQMTQLVEAGANQKNDFDKWAKENAQQLEKCENERAANRAERDKFVETIQRDFEASSKRNDADLTKERQQRQAAEKRLVDLQKRLAVQQEKLGGLLIGPEKLATARQPDGKVLTAVPGDSMVYINLGRQHGLTLGLRFAVYSAQTGIPEDGRAKAQIEVVSISDNSAECRIVNITANEVILEGDLIANPVYDPNRPLTFVVLGEFDLNRDGLPDRDGAATLESLITDWGGKVSTELTPLTDFVVLGAAPRRPKAAGEGADQAAPSAAKDPAQRAWARYNELFDSAKTLSVPILTQDVFLNFLGYGGRFAVR